MDMPQPKNPRPRGHEEDFRNNSPFPYDAHGHAPGQDPPPRGPQNLQPCQTALAITTTHGQCTGAEKKIRQEIHQPYTLHPKTTFSDKST